METLYEKIKTVVEAGRIAITQNKDGCYRLWSSMTDDGDIRGAGYSSIMQFVYDVLGKFDYTKDEIDILEKDGEKFIGVYSPEKLRVPKPGDKVEILECVKQRPGYEDWHPIYNGRIGGPYEVYNLKMGNVLIRTESKNSSITIPLSCLAPWVDRDEQKPVELTINEIAEKFNIDPKLLKIKK